MQTIWINKSLNKSCILFFNGWGMDEHAIMHLSFGNHDICMLNDYSSIEPLDDSLNNYEQIIVIAWSMGIWAAERAISISNLHPSICIAINGTPCPINENYGIVPSFFEVTVNDWNTTMRDKFNTRLMGGKKQLELMSDRLSTRSIDNQKQELACLYNMVMKTNNPSLSWNKVIIGLSDKMFFNINQINWWTGKTIIEEVDMPHYPFNTFKSWDEIIERHNA